MRDPIKRAVLLLKQYFNSSGCLTPAPTILVTYSYNYTTFTITPHLQAAYQMHLVSTIEVS